MTGLARPPHIQAREAHVWLIDLNPAPASVAVAAARLAPDEHARADRFRFAEGKRRYSVARGQLRAILGSYTGTAPQALVFGYEPNGKPFLEQPAGDLQFNLAHSHEAGAVAVTRQSAIGIDIEYDLRRIDLRAIAERFFAPGEVAQLFSLPLAEQPAAFRRCWTRKEAILKARGDGLMLPLDRYEVSLLPADPPRVVRVAPELDQAPWTLLDVEAPEGYIAALAIAGDSARLVQHGLWPAPTSG